MADIVGSLSKIQVEETDFNSPVSEALNTKYGANINALIDLISQGYTVYTSNGTYTTDANVTRIDVVACGGGAGGWGNENSGEGGLGGVGAQPMFATISVTGNTTYSVTIGGGGAGDGATGQMNPGAPGGNTVFGSSLLVFPGAVNPGTGQPPGTYDISDPGYNWLFNGVGSGTSSGVVNAASTGRIEASFVFNNVLQKTTVAGGGIFNMGGILGASGTRSLYAAGGSPGGSFGGGGGAGLGAGGNGGASSLAAGGNGGIGAGGGGGGPGNGSVGGVGGNGGAGFLAVRPG